MMVMGQEAPDVLVVLGQHPVPGASPCAKAYLWVLVHSEKFFLCPIDTFRSRATRLSSQARAADGLTSLLPCERKDGGEAP